MLDKLWLFTIIHFVVAIYFQQYGAVAFLNNKLHFKEKVKEMFFHAYDNYLNKAFPADELMPLSCKGRYRGSEPSRGDVDDSLGNFSLTLIDSLDTLFLMNETVRFEEAIRLVIKHVNFDSDIVVSVFETNIRVLGGLLGGHFSALALKAQGLLLWYSNELLAMATDIGNRLLPAFNTTTGLPYPRINLRHSLCKTYSRTGTEQDTCTACGGTMLLEFAALSRLSGNPIYEQIARQALDTLWEQRNRQSDLVGTVINIHSGDWVRRDSGVGAGIDSYYEYLLKGYIMLGEDVYLHRFNKHYQAVMQYVKVKPLPMLLDVLMHKPDTRTRNYVDALHAFWPGLQVLKGDVRAAVEMHEVFRQVVQRHSFLPEAYTTDFHVHWAQHPLRPEFVESTYLLYKATQDPHYLEIGEKVIENLEKHARVECGFAALRDVRSMAKEDQMDSFVLAETFKYLYLLFAESAELPIDLDQYVLTTEAHLLPLGLATLSAEDDKQKSSTFSNKDLFVNDGLYARSCPNQRVRFPVSSLAQEWRLALKNTVDKLCPTVSSTSQSGEIGQNNQQLLRPTEFDVGNQLHLDLIRRMGIQVVHGESGKLQLYHNPSTAENEELAMGGLKFMTEMIRISEHQAARIAPVEPLFVQVVNEPLYGSLVLRAGPAQFGFNLSSSDSAAAGVRGSVQRADPLDACQPLQPHVPLEGEDDVGKKPWIALLRRGGCMFVDKARNAQKAGAVAAIILDNTADTSADSHTLFAMSGDGTNDVTIPVVFLFSKEGFNLLALVEKYGSKLEVLVTSKPMSQESLIHQAVDVFLAAAAKRQSTPVAATTSTSSDANTVATSSTDDSIVKRSSLVLGGTSSLSVIHLSDAASSSVVEVSKHWICISPSEEFSSKSNEFNLWLRLDKQLAKVFGMEVSSSSSTVNWWNEVAVFFERRSNLAQLVRYKEYIEALRELVMSVDNVNKKGHVSRDLQSLLGDLGRQLVSMQLLQDDEVSASEVVLHYRYQWMTKKKGGGALLQLQLHELERLIANAAGANKDKKSEAFLILNRDLRNIHAKLEADNAKEGMWTGVSSLQAAEKLLKEFEQLLSRQLQATSQSLKSETTADPPDES